MTESSILKSGFTLGRGLGRKLYLSTFLGLYPTTIGGSLGVLGGLSIGGGVIIYGLSLTSKLNNVTLSEDVLSPSVVPFVVV